MTSEELKDKILEIVTPYVQDQEALRDFSPETDFLKDLKVNSANLVDIILDVEDEFGISLDNEEMEQMVTVRSVIELLEKKVDQR